MLIKWRLMLKAVPITLAVLAAKLGIDLGLGWPGAIEFADAGLVLTGGVFLIGFMLAGTMADYKESEKLPGDLACALEAVEDNLVQAALASPQLDAKAMRNVVLDLTTSILDWLYKRVEVSKVFENVDRVSAALQEVERAGNKLYATEGLKMLQNVRRALTRIDVISRTGFLPPGYALLETLAGAIMVLMLISRFKTLLAEVILVSFVTLIFIYMLSLIRDVDDPFEYTQDGQGRGADVDLFPLTNYRERLTARSG